MPSRLRYFIDWKPVASLPVNGAHNLHQYEVFHGQELTDLLKDWLSPALIGRVAGVEFAARQDGIFIFSLSINETADEASPDPAGTLEVPEIANAVSNAIKTKRLDHFHQFHYITRDPTPWLYRFRFDPDIFLSVAPLEIEIDFNSHIQDIVTKDNYLKEISTKTQTGAAGNPALLELREIFSRKRDLCIGQQKNLKKIERYFVVGSIATLPIVGGVGYSLYYFNVAPAIPAFITTICLVIALYCYAYIFVHRLPSIKFIRYTIGFLSFAEVYSHVLDEIYDSRYGRGHFGNAIQSLETTLSDVIQAMENQREVARFVLVLGALVVAISSMS